MVSLALRPCIPSSWSMSLAVEVGLISGRTIALEAAPDEKLQSVKHRAQNALGVSKGRLLDASGRTLDGLASIKEAGINNGDSLTLQISGIQASGNVAAFAAILGDGSVLTWGSAGHGGDSSAVQDQLKNVSQIQASDCAFAALLGNGRVVTWGNDRFWW